MGEDQGWWDRMISEGRVIPARRDLIQVLEERILHPR